MVLSYNASRLADGCREELQSLVHHLQLEPVSVDLTPELLKLPSIPNPGIALMAPLWRADLTSFHQLAGTHQSYRRTLASLKQEIRSLETHYFKSKNIDLLAAISSKLDDLQEKAIRETRYLHRDTQTWHGEGDCPDRTLVRLLCPPYAATYTAELLESDHNPASTTQEIWCVTSSFYAQLCSVTPTLTRLKYSEYFDTRQLVRLDHAHRAHHAYLDTYITSKEIMQVMVGLPGDKAPDGDCLPTAL
ncbi:hypothetical protein NDU88_000807 [Pleurodeles waltl]|uniref:Uncharacterized protein n=1 Tax=Pleurodeles waltl TaxID=8319 RepID=A0AAV7SXF3_PLEWA|nr:hypothetical protein NDU88_000807 [Pleurodeles waltl]